MSASKLLSFKVGAAKGRFVAKLLWGRVARQPRLCPYCKESDEAELLHRKKWIMDVLRCRKCLLIYRWPCDSLAENRDYYQKRYVSGVATHLPEAQGIAEMKARCFKGYLGLDLSTKIQVLKAVKGSGRVLDFGCSWGYGVYQLLSEGFDATGFEISEPRADYGRRNLGVRIVSDQSELSKPGRAGFDVVFTNHVLEHLPAISSSFDLFWDALVPGGVMVNVLPNFAQLAATTGAEWRWIGEHTPIAPTVEFFRRNLPRHGFTDIRIASGPFDERLIEAVRSDRTDLIGTEGEELLVVGTKGPAEE
jgi:SAM-dependent methyltransferase